jgi:hypothetical protein
MERVWESLRDWFYRLFGLAAVAFILAGCSATYGARWEVGFGGFRTLAAEGPDGEVYYADGGRMDPLGAQIFRSGKGDTLLTAAWVAMALVGAITFFRVRRTQRELRALGEDIKRVFGPALLVSVALAGTAPGQGMARPGQPGGPRRIEERLRELQEVRLALGTTADAFVQHYGDRGLRALTCCALPTARGLVLMHRDGTLARCRFAEEALELIGGAGRQQGPAVAAYFVAHFWEFCEEDGVKWQCFRRAPAEYAYGFAELNRDAAAARAQFTPEELAESPEVAASELHELGIDPLGGGDYVGGSAFRQLSVGLFLFLLAGALVLYVRGRRLKGGGP